MGVFSILGEITGLPVGQIGTDADYIKALDSIVPVPGAANRIIMPQPSERTNKLDSLQRQINSLWPRGTWEYPVTPTTIVLYKTLTACQSTLNALQRGISEHSGPWDAQINTLIAGLNRKKKPVEETLAKFQHSRKEWETGIDVKDVCMRALIECSAASFGLDYIDANDSLSWLPSWAEIIIQTFVDILNAVADAITWIVKSGFRAIGFIGKYAPVILWGSVGLYVYSKVK